MITTDGLRSCGAAMRELGNSEKREVGRWANNRVENSLQAFASVHASFHNHFNQERHLTSRETFKANRSAALAEWRTLAA